MESIYHTHAYIIYTIFKIINSKPTLEVTISLVLGKLENGLNAGPSSI